MDEFIVGKLPDSVKFAYIDSDSIAYIASFTVQKSHYKYTNKETGEESVEFDSAKKGKQWLAHQQEEAELFGYSFNIDDWEREKIVVIGDEIEAKKSVETVINSWLKYAKGREWTGYLTEKGEHKNKDLPGLERRYQGNRDGLVSPKFLMVCRDYMLDKPEFHMVKNGFEADSIVIAKAEKKGKAGCLMSLDKDLRQAENTYIIDMSYDPPLVTIADNNVGGVWECPIKSKEKLKKYNGCGAKWLCFQAVAGDNADHYGGIKGVGGASVIKTLEGCNTHKECLDAIYKTYYEPHGMFNYTSWDGKEMHLTPAEMLLQHFNLAYQERRPNDEFTFEKWGMVNPDREFACNG